MEILLWLVPPVVVAAVAMLWASWVGREGRGEVDREEAVRRLGVALEKDPPVHDRPPRRARVRSTGVALRRARRRAPQTSQAPVRRPGTQPGTDSPQRRAS